MSRTDLPSNPLEDLGAELPVVTPPAEVWTSIDAALDRNAHADVARIWRRRPVMYAFAAAAVLALAVVAATVWFAQRANPWDVVRLDGPGGPVRMSEGEWLETGAGDQARIQIGTIGTVEIEPNTRMRLISARREEQRLAMSRGRISAQILAPPRLFFVETPASVVVDLGCAYTMDVDESGVGTLRVTSGWASLEWDLRESLVPAGASCLTRPDIGPGTPCFDDASDRMKRALLAFDFGEGDDKTSDEAALLDVIFAEARPRDTLSLWHLIDRVSPPERARVFDRIAQLVPVPEGVSREAALALNRETLTRWREELAWVW